MSVYKDYSDLSESKEKRFDSFLNKTIILASKGYFKKQMNIMNKERVIVDDENYSAFIQEYITLDRSIGSIDELETTLQLNNALHSLSAIEQAVIFLLFQEELSQEESAKILEICSRSVSRIKLRAITKLRKYLEGGLANEK